MCSANKKSYQAQAVIIAMIVVVISVIIGMAVLARALRDNKSATAEKLSSEAIEISDSLINIFSTADSDSLFNSVENENDNVKKIENISDLGEYLLSLGIETNVSSLFSNCDNASSGVSVSMEKVANEQLEISESTTMGYIVNPLSVSGSCELILSTEPKGITSVGFIVHKIYGKGYPSSIEYKSYDLDDITAYCISNIAQCTNEKLEDSSWIVKNETEKIKIALDEIKDGYYLDEVRITPIGGSIGVTSTLNNLGCAGSLDLNLLKISVTTTCSGESRGKEILFPRSNNLTYSTLFDYVIYNSNGLFQPY